MRSLPLTLLAAFLAIAGCNKPESGGDSPSPEPTPTPTPDPPATTTYFKATINDLYLQGPDDTGCSFMIDTNMKESEWTVETDADWIIITKKSDEVILVPQTIEQSQDYPAPRTGNVTVKAGDLFNKSFKMVQEAWTRLYCESEVRLNPSGETVEVPVSHNCYSWTATCDASWVKIKKTDTSTLLITASERASADSSPRSATIHLESDRDAQTFWNITVCDEDSNLGNEDYTYGDQTDWD